MESELWLPGSGNHRISSPCRGFGKEKGRIFLGRSRGHGFLDADLFLFLYPTLSDFADFPSFVDLCRIYGPPFGINDSHKKALPRRGSRTPPPVQAPTEDRCPHLTGTRGTDKKKMFTLW